MSGSSLDSDILHYIVEHQINAGDRLPTINELSAELGISVSKLREDLAVARALGYVQIKPRIGTQVQEFCFGPAATLGVLYALERNRHHFQHFAKLRRSVELGFWHEAVASLTPEDIAHLRHLITRAQEKLNYIPVMVPFQEHRSLHLTFFKRLNNPFVQGLLEAYWIAYEAYGLSMYADLSYHHEVWNYHERMVEYVAQGDFEGGYQALKEHMELLRYVPDQPAHQDASKSTERDPSIHHFFE
ncbi:MAG: FadR family transcriptional regulator [Chloroflexi bacterium]|nr:FadR family transcriptional regulator [Chloroflexota bacterium]